MRTNARGHRARFVKGMKKNAGAATRARRAAAYRNAKRKGLTGNRAVRSALRKVPFTSNERKRGAKFKGSTARYRSNPLIKHPRRRAEMPGEMAVRQIEEREGKPRKKRKASAKQIAAARRNIKKAQAARRKKTRKRAKGQYKKVPTTRRRKVTVTKRQKGYKRVRYRYGKYTRAKLTNPRTGRRQYSYMYRGKGGRLRRIPYSAIVGSTKSKGHDKRHAKYMKARERAAQRILKSGGPFVANRRRDARGRFRKNAAKSARRRKQIARKAAQARWGKKRRKAKRKGGKKRKTSAKQRAAARRNIKKAQAARRKGGRKRKGGKKRKGRKMTKARRRAAALKGWRKRRGGGRRSVPKSRARKLKRGVYYVSNRRRRRRAGRRPVRRRRRRYASNRRRRSRRLTPNQMKSLFKKAITTGGLVVAGILVHRLLTSLAQEYIVPKLRKAPAAAPPAATEAFTMAAFERPLTGLAVLAVGLPLTAVTLGRMPSKNPAVCVGAGMVASWFHSLVVSVLAAAEQPKIAAQLAGYPNSMAYALRGRRGGYRGYRGFGQAGGRGASIMPRYAQVGQFRQAAAGIGQGYRAALAGRGGRLGEYFKPSPVGEYFVPSSVQGVGQYEAAGPLAMQAAAGFGQAIDDGIKPDSNLDAVLDLAEAAAGLRGRAMRGMGEYFTAVPGNGGMVEQRVPTQSQWIPSGPLWAGTLSVKDQTAQSELPAGILAGPGGNGILSGG